MVHSLAELAAVLLFYATWPQTQKVSKAATMKIKGVINAR